MAIIAAKCTQCGANIEVDNTKEAGICGHCGTAFITEKVINHYITHNYDNRTVIKNIYGEEKLDADGYIEKAETFLRLNDYDNAEKQFKLAIEAEPSNWKGWFGIVECCTKNFTNLNDKRHKTYLERARKVADKESLSKMNSIYNSYANIVHKAVHKAKLKRESCIKFIVAVAVIFATFAFMLISIVIWAS